MSDLPPISQKVQMDLTNYKAGITELNRGIRVVESEFRAAAAGMKDWSKDASGLEARIKALTSTMDLQRQKVDGLQRVYDELAKSGKASAKELQELQIKINKETESLNKMQTELTQSETALGEMGKEAKTAGDKTEEMGEKTEKAAEKTNQFGAVMRGLGGAAKIGAAAIAAVGAAALAAVGAIAGLVLKSADLAGELVDTANVTGIGVERLQELAFIGGQIGVSTETMTGSLAKLTRSMGAAADGTGDQAKAFKQLGISLKNSDGSLRSSQDVWQESLAALGGIANETERDVLAMALFGKSAMELNPLIKTSAEEMEAMKRKAREMGAVISEDNVNALESFGDTLAGLKAGLQGTLGTLAAAVLPGLKGLTGGAEKYMTMFANIVSFADGDMASIAQGVGSLLGQIVNDLAAQAPALLQGGLSIVQGILNAILGNLPVLLPAAISIITMLVEFLVTNLPLLINAGIQIVMALVNGILPMLPLLIQAALTMLITLATGIAQALPALIPAVVAIIPKIIEILIANLPLLIMAALQLILALVQGLLAALPILIEAIPTLVTAIVETIIQNLPMIIQAALEIILALITGLVTNFPLLLEAVVDLIAGVIEVFTETDWAEIGMNIVSGISTGFSNMWATFVADVATKFKELWAKIKALLGIQSPSKVYANIGENMALGLGAGFGRAFDQVQRDVAGAIDGLTNMNLALSPTLTPALSQGGRGSGGGNIYVTVEVGNVTSEIDWHWAARKVAEEIRRWS